MSKKLPTIVSVGRLPQPEAVACAKDREPAHDPIPSHAVEFELIDERASGAVRMTRPHDGQFESAPFGGTLEVSLARKLVSTVSADGFLRKRFVDEDLGRDFNAVGAHR